MSGPVVLIGWDGATFSILDALVAQGVMPCLKRLLHQGVRAELASVIPPLTPPAWTSLMTGRSPGNHGIFDFLRFDYRPEGQQLRVLNSKDVACETIWSIANRHHLNTTVLNFPSTFPAPKISGNVVPGWVPWRHLRMACYPSTLFDRLTSLQGFNAKELAMDMALEERALEGCHREEDYEIWITLHTRREQQWFKVLTHLMDHEPAELTAVLFDGVDKLQHVCWRFLDPAFLGSSPSAWELRIRDLCLDYFREVDRILGEIIERSGVDATVILASDHGFGPTVEVFYLNAWLREHGYLVWTESQVEGKHTETLGLGTMARRFYEVDWNRTTAYCPTPSSNGIYISPPSADGKSGVPAEQYETFRRELKQALLAYTDPANGECVVSQIWTKEEAFSGSEMAAAPDLTLALRDGGLVSILPSEVLLKPRDEVAGAHRPNGVFVAKGPGIRRGVSVPMLSILDVAPVMLHALGLAIPHDLEGRLPEEIFDPAFLHAHAIAFQAPSLDAAKEIEQNFPMHAGMEAEVLQHLRALGYLE